MRRELDESTAERRRKRKVRSPSMSALSAVLLTASVAAGLPEGWNDSAGCTGSGCHDMADPTFAVSLEGPATLGLGESATYTLSVDPTLVGAGFAAELLGGGFIGVVSPNTEVQGSAVTHSRRNDGVFSYEVQVTAPSAPTTLTLQASMLAYNDGNGAGGDTWNVGMLDVDVSASVCGNGALEGDEQCDDGNTGDGDGCSSTCLVETTCGDGVLEGSEQCDDGNTIDGDGCSPECLIQGVCGDGEPNQGEECDDGNTVDGDGCSAACALETQPLVGELKLKIGLKFNKPGKDSISLKVNNLQLPDDLEAAGAALILDIGGNVADVTLDPKGKYKSGSDKAKLKQGKDGSWQLSFSRKGALAADLADEGLVDEDNPKPGKQATVDVQLNAGGQAYGASVGLTYKSKLGKNGKAK
jgi:cysteine-rich repeat protein